MTLEQKLQHLYWRAGFGPELLSVNKPKSIPEAVRQLMANSQIIELLKVPIPQQDKTIPLKDQPEEEKKKFREAEGKALRELNNTWLYQMAFSKAQLREKMTLFWHNHFACRSSGPNQVKVQNNTFRQYALGSFPDLLLAVSKNPLMLQFLNNQQNQKKRPNENFARELLELFTLGRGHYTEQDIKEAARAFTGWGYNNEGEFVFREKQHDSGEKTFLGKTGAFNGEDILKIIIENPRTAEFLTSKIYTFFVSDVPHPARVQKLSKVLYNSNYNISVLLETIFKQKWFYSPEVVGAHIKSPVELLAGLQRTFQVKYADDRSAITLQKALGQELFQPPNVGGWPGGRSWIDSSSLAFRLNVGPTLVQSAPLEIALKPNDDSEPAKPSTKRRDGLRIAQAKASLTGLNKYLAGVPTVDLPVSLSRLLLQTTLSETSLQLLQKEANAVKSREDKIKQLTLKILSMPEYQLS